MIKLETVLPHVHEVSHMILSLG